MNWINGLCLNKISKFFRLTLKEFAIAFVHQKNSIFGFDIKASDEKGTGLKILRIKPGAGGEVSKASENNLANEISERFLKYC